MVIAAIAVIYDSIAQSSSLFHFLTLGASNKVQARHEVRDNCNRQLKLAECFNAATVNISEIVFLLT
jgi:hypothetical protein